MKGVLDKFHKNGKWGDCNQLCSLFQKKYETIRKFPVLKTLKSS